MTGQGLEDGRALEIRVELVSGPPGELSPPPGRDFSVDSMTTFATFASAISLGLGRWDLSHLYEFRLADGRVIGPVDEDRPDILDDETTCVGDAVREGETFTFVFDFGDWWEHRCTVVRELLVTYDRGMPLGEDDDPEAPYAIFGWGSLPDQYGRDQPDD